MFNFNVILADDGGVNDAIRATTSTVKFTGQKF